MAHHFITKLTEGGGPPPSDELRYLIDEARHSPASTAWLGTRRLGAAWHPAPEPSPSLILAIHVEPTGRVAAVLAKIIGRRNLMPEAASVREFYGPFGAAMRSWWELSEPLALTFQSLDEIPGTSSKGRRAREAFRSPWSFAYWNFDAYDLVASRAISPGASARELPDDEAISRAIQWPRKAEVPEFLAFDAHGDARFKGHRISLFHVLDFYQEGADPARIREEFPSLSITLIEKSLEYFRANRAVLDEYLDRYRVELDRQEASATGGGPDLAELTRREMARRRAAVR